MNDFSDMLVRWVDQRLAHILAAPPMCGSPEAVELQVLQLMEVRALALRPNQELKNPRGVFDAYLSYLSRRFPRQPRQPLFELVGQDDDKYSKLAAGLRGFIIEASIPTTTRRRPPSLAPSESHDWLAVA